MLGTQCSLFALRKYTYVAAACFVASGCGGRFDSVCSVEVRNASGQALSDFDSHTTLRSAPPSGGVSANPFPNNAMVPVYRRVGATLRDIDHIDVQFKDDSGNLHQATIAQAEIDAQVKGGGKTARFKIATDFTVAPE